MQVHAYEAAACLHFGVIYSVYTLALFEDQRFIWFLGHVNLIAFMNIILKTETMSISIFKCNPMRLYLSETFFVVFTFILLFDANILGWF
jgi:hypothetical protein